MPTFAGAILTGYNYFLDSIIFILSKLGIPAIFSYFKALPIIWFIIYTVLIIALARQIKNSPLFVGLLLFFLYFSESFSYLLQLFHYKTIWDSAGLLANQKVHMMSNLPFAFSVLILLTILIFIQKKEVNFKTVIIISLLNFLNFGLKFYGGVITSFLIFVYILFKFFNKDRKQFFLSLSIHGLSIILAILLFYNPFYSLKSGSAFIISPFALIHTITEEPKLFYLRDLTNARYYLITKGIGPRLVLIEIFNLVVFLFFYLGVKFFGLLFAFYKFFRGKLTVFDWYVLLTTIWAIFLTTIFVQKGEWWNIIQFFYYAIFLSSIFTAQLVYNFLIRKKFLTYLSAVVLILLALPVNLDIVKHYFSFPAPSYIPKKELEALSFLKKQPKGVVFTSLYEKRLKSPLGLNEMYRYEDTAYVAAFSGKPVYFANITQLRLTGVDYQGRLKRIQNGDCQIIEEIDYFYYLPQLRQAKDLIKCAPSRFQKIFSNEAAIIYAVKK